MVLKHRCLGQDHARLGVAVVVRLQASEDQVEGFIFDRSGDRAGSVIGIETDKGSFTAPALVLATGGLSILKMGASGFAYEIARRFDLEVIEPRPGLVPLKVTGETLELCNEVGLVKISAIGGEAGMRAGLGSYLGKGLAEA